MGDPVWTPYVQLLGDYKLVEIANHFGMKHYGGVASAIHMVKAELANDKKAQKTINSIVKRFDPESFHMVKAELANDKKAQKTINSIVKRFDPESFGSSLMSQR
jgi:hypothetical protein